MSKIRYYITKVWKGHYGEKIHFDGIIEIDDIVTKSVDDSHWRDVFYLKTDQEVAEHIAFNMIVNDLKLSQMDGFTNLSDDMVRIVR